MKIAEMLRNLAGQEVVLLGSAPTRPDTALPEGAKVASVNGSHRAFGLNYVDALFVNSFAFKGDGLANSAVQDALDDVTCGTLIYIDGAGLGDMPPIRHDQAFRIEKTTRSQVLEWATGATYPRDAAGNAVPSTGLTAALILRKLGCKVVLHGFSLGDGHALLDGSPRMHKEQDGRYLPLFETLLAVLP